MANNTFAPKIRQYNKILFILTFRLCFGCPIAENASENILILRYFQDVYGRQKLLYGRSIGEQVPIATRILFSKVVKSQSSQRRRFFSSSEWIPTEPEHRIFPQIRTTPTKSRRIPHFRIFLIPTPMIRFGRVRRSVGRSELRTLLNNLLIFESLDMYQRGDLCYFKCNCNFSRFIVN